MSLGDQSKDILNNIVHSMAIRVLHLMLPLFMLDFKSVASIFHPHFGAVSVMMVMSVLGH